MRFKIIAPIAIAAKNHQSQVREAFESPHRVRFITEEFPRACDYCSELTLLRSRPQNDERGKTRSAFT